VKLGNPASAGARFRVTVYRAVVFVFEPTRKHSGHQTVFFRLLASAYWRSRTLRPPNHVRYVDVRIYELHLYTGMTTCEDPKDFVCECLADLIDVFKIKHNRTESIDA
jgi:hypothetical protein